MLVRFQVLQDLFVPYVLIFIDFKHTELCCFWFILLKLLKYSVTTRQFIFKKMEEMTWNFERFLGMKLNLFCITKETKTYDTELKLIVCFYSAWFKFSELINDKRNKNPISLTGNILHWKVNLDSYLIKFQ